MDRIDQLLPKVLKRRGLHEHAVASHVVQIAQRWLVDVLPGLQQDFRVHALRDGVLLIECQSSIASQECFLRSNDLLAHLHTVHPDIRIESIRTTRA